LSLRLCSTLSLKYSGRLAPRNCQKILRRTYLFSYIRILLFALHRVFFIDIYYILGYFDFVHFWEVFMRNGKPVVLVLEDDANFSKLILQGIGDCVHLFMAIATRDACAFFKTNAAEIDLVVLDSTVIEAGFDRPQRGEMVAHFIFDTMRWVGPGIATSNDPGRRSEMTAYFPEGMAYSADSKFVIASKVLQVLREIGKLS
jgi:hypothetical protein